MHAYPSILITGIDGADLLRLKQSFYLNQRKYINDSIQTKKHRQACEILLRLVFRIVHLCRKLYERI